MNKPERTYLKPKTRRWGYCPYGVRRFTVDASLVNKPIIGKSYRDNFGIAIPIPQKETSRQRFKRRKDRQWFYFTGTKYPYCGATPPPKKKLRWSVTTTNEPEMSAFFKRSNEQTLKDGIGYTGPRNNPHWEWTYESFKASASKIDNNEDKTN